MIKKEMPMSYFNLGGKLSSLSGIPSHEDNAADVLLEAHREQAATHRIKLVMLCIM